MNKLPYIGCTDFASPDQVYRVLQYCTPQRRLHVGVMCSYKTINGIKSQWTHVWPDEPSINNIFAAVKFGCNPFNVVHYADYDFNPPTTTEDLLKAVARCGPNVHGLQLDMIWPRVGMIEEFKSYHPNIEIILQVGYKAMEMNPFWMKTLEVHKPHVDYVLLDAGMGQGTTFNLIDMIPQIYATMGAGFQENQIAVAGGFGPMKHQHQKMQQLLQKFPQLSCDAQSRLRPSGDSHDPLDEVYAAMYVQSISNYVEGK